MQPTSQYAKEIAQTILQQMGGRHFVAMTGVRNLVYGENQWGPYLQMRLSKNKNRYTHLIVQYYEATDIYGMDFMQVNKDGIRKSVEIPNVYCDDLAELFEEHTGLYTSL